MQFFNENFRLYVCAKLAVIYPDAEVDHYFSPDYLKTASAILNTDNQKIIFDSLALAERELRRRGTTWCIYEIAVPNAESTKQPFTLLIQENDIKNITFHAASSFAAQIKAHPELVLKM